jgi:4-amino-4-deoxy-L-arabinose transferase-like glycosyltransferase
LWFAVLLPIAYIIVTHAVIYDATRHILFTYPPIAAIAGIGGATIWDKFKSTRRGVLLAIALFVGGLFGIEALSTGGDVVYRVEAEGVPLCVVTRKIVEEKRIRDVGPYFGPTS